MRDCRFPLSVKPKHTRCSSVLVVDPVNDFVPDLGARAIEPLLCLIQPNSPRAFQEVGGNVFIDMFGTILCLESGNLFGLEERWAEENEQQLQHHYFKHAAGIGFNSRSSSGKNI